MLNLVRELYTGAVAGLRVRRLERELQENLLMGMSYRTPYIDTDTVSITPGRAPRQFRINSLGMHLKTIDASREFYEQNPFARNIVTQVTNHVVGKGFAVKFETIEEANVWRMIARSIRWPRRRREIMRRMVRDGECFLRKFGPGQIRFVEPHSVVPFGQYTTSAPWGIQTAEGDVETIEGYCVDGEFVPAEEMFHFKLPDCDINDLRSWSLLHDAKPTIDDYSNFVKDRGLLNRYRASILMFRKFKGPAAAKIRQIQDKVKDGTLTKSSGEQAPFNFFQNSGRVVDHSEDVEYDFKAPNVGSQDAAEDGRAQRLLIAVFFSFPEYVVTSDASNANFASTAVAESPGVKAMEAWQDGFAADLAEFIPWVTDSPLSQMEFVFPSLISRQELAITQARQIRFQNGVLSGATWMEMDGIDPEKETRRLVATAGASETIA